MVFLGKMIGISAEAYMYVYIYIYIYIYIRHKLILLLQSKLGHAELMCFIGWISE